MRARSRSPRCRPFARFREARKDGDSRKGKGWFMSMSVLGAWCFVLRRAWCFVLRRAWCFVLGCAWCFVLGCAWCFVFGRAWCFVLGSRRVVGAISCRVVEFVVAAALVVREPRTKHQAPRGTKHQAPS